MKIPELSKQKVGESSRKHGRETCLSAEKCKFTLGSHQEVGKHRKHLSSHTGLTVVQCGSYCSRQKEATLGT